MINKIFKYELNIVDIQNVSMPNGAKVISAHMQNEKICIWTLVDETASKKEKLIAIIGTGHKIIIPINDFEFYFVGTVVFSNLLTFHVFANNK